MTPGEREVAELRRVFRELSGIEMPPRGAAPAVTPPRPPMVRRNGPPPNMGRAVRWWCGGMLFGAAMWVVLLGIAWWTLGCATGRIVRDDVEITCAAIGESARVTYSVPTGEAGIITSAPTQLVACEGGPLVPSLLDGIGTMVKGLFSWIVL